MLSEFEIYTGTLSYKEIEYFFVFDGKKLRLTLTKDRPDKMQMFKMKLKTNFLGRNPEYIEEDCLIGNCNETYTKIIFFLKPPNEFFRDVDLIINIEAYIIQKDEKEYFNGLNFMCQELDYIYPTNQALHPLEFSESGITSVTTKDFSIITSTKQDFCIDKKNVSVYFSISQIYPHNVGKPPLELHSIMRFEFEESKDYTFILKLYHIAKYFIQYLCYRKNVRFSEIHISSPYNKEKYKNFATLHIVNQVLDNEPEILEKGRYIKQEYINGAEGKILNDIAENKLYLRHLPETYRTGRNIDPARFVMITAAFEWTFKKNYPDGIEKSPKTIDAEKIATQKLNSLVNDSSGKLKEIYKFLRKHIRDNSLQSEIQQVGNEYSNTVNIFGNRLYSTNNESLNYSKIGKRISKQRNNYAHGKLDNEFVGLALLDLCYLEYIIYAMQLKEYGIETISIQKAISDLFGCHIRL